MTIRIKNLTVKNFMSVGNATQGVNFDRQDLTLVLGENLDLGGDDNGSRNGTGKTTIVNALSYAFYGQALTNIKKDNLINKTNSKNMVVTIEFEKNGQPYKIERGRKPNFITFYVGDKAVEAQDSDSQGDSRETQAEIEKLLEMSHDMFKHVVALNTYTEPFLSLRANDQRVIIEQLLGITLLSEKADSLKELNKAVKDEITAEEINIKSITDANKRFQEQIEALKRRQKLWLTKKSEDLIALQEAYDLLLNIDIESEIKAHNDLKEWTKKDAELTQIKKDATALKATIDKEIARVEKIVKELESLRDHKCHSCGQDLHDSKHEELLARKENDEAELREHILALQTEWVELDILYGKETVGPKPETFYKKLEEALEHKSSIAHLKQQIVTKAADNDPYDEQIIDMSSSGIVEVKYDKINDLTKLKEHQDFLLKLLTSKDSFIRKQIINQNLTFLNKRLSYYLDKVGLPHQVVFQNDLTVEISELGRDLDFDNLSRGERGRLILSLSWAFRDVWESLYHPINLLFIDELIDNGLDSNGVEAALATLKKMARDHNKSVWLVSHKDELTNRVNNILNVVKENGFTTYGNEIENV
jgi:DNA repair exonuclease SbcCD ATPase subunit